MPLAVNTGGFSTSGVVVVVVVGGVIEEGASAETEDRDAEGTGAMGMITPREFFKGCVATKSMLLNGGDLG